MDFIYKNLFALPNLRPYTKHKKRIIPAIVTGRISSIFLLLYYTPNSLCWLDGGPPTKTLCQKLGGVLQNVGGSGPPPPNSLSGCALDFGKYYPILIILSLLETEINYDQVYAKTYHHTSNLLVHCKMNKNVLANGAGMIS